MHMRKQWFFDNDVYVKIGVLRKNIQPRRSLLVSFLTISLLLIVSLGSLLAQFFSSTPKAHAAPAPANTAVLTYKNNNAHTGWNPNETNLNTNNVNSSQFGKQVSYSVDGQIYAQPLYVPDLTINGAVHNVVFVETEHDSIYAFDADATATAAPLWQRSFLGAGITSVPSNDLLGCNDLSPEVGITGTPVIDSATNTMYVLPFTKENGVFTYRLHAIDLTTGNDKATPIIIQGSVPGVGSGAINNSVTFQPIHERNRTALLEANGQIYVAYGSFCDIGPFHAWIFGYTFDGTKFNQAEIFNNTPNGSGSGIWSPGGISTDANGNIIATTGNGDFDLNTGGTESGDSFIKLNPQLQLEDYFTPFNQHCLDERDTDLGSGGPLILNALNEIISGGKEGRPYVLNSNNMGGYTVDPNLDCTQGSPEQNNTTIDKVLQELPPSTVGGIYSTPAYWNGPNGQYVYLSGSGSVTRQYQLNNGLLVTPNMSQTPESFGFTGGNPVISSNGSTSGTGILWLVTSDAELHAFDASNINTELYNSGQNAARDALDSYVKFSVPTVANGEVFVGTSTALDIYSTHPITTIPTPTTTGTSVANYNNVGISDDTAPGTGNFDGQGDSYSYQSLVVAGLNPGDNAFQGNMVFTWPNVVAGQADNYVASGQTISVSPVPNANEIGFLGASTGGASSGIATINYVGGGSQSITLGFSDWHQNSNLSFGNAIEASAPYYNNEAGQQNQPTNVFSTSFAISSTKAIQSVTLPSIALPGTMHIFAISTLYVPKPAVYNNIGTSDDSNPRTGNFDGANSYSAQALAQANITPGAIVNYNGASFTWPNVPAGQKNNYTTQGQQLSITPVTGATALAFLGASTGGNSSGTGVVIYTDGTTQTFTLGMSDWTLGGGTNLPAFGNQVVATTAYRNTSTSQQTSSKPVILYSEIALAYPTKTVQYVDLPVTIVGGQIHIFTVTTKGGSVTTPTPTPTPTVTPTPTPTVTPTQPSAVPYNNIAVSDDSNVSAGNFDGANSYSAQALAQVNITPGAAITFNGVTFIWPAPAPGTNDNYSATGQVLPVTSVSGATTLAFLGASINGNNSGVAVITYTDGTTQSFTLGLSDWTLGGGGNAPAFGNQIVATTAYRNTPNGAQTTDKPNVFYTDVMIQPGKTVQSVTLPTGRQIHIFAVSTR